MANQEIIPWKFDERAKQRFLNELAQTGRRYHSAACADTTMLTVRAHLDDDPEFAEAYDVALQDYAEAVQAEVKRRGITGYDEPVFHQGRQGMTPAYDSDGQVIIEQYVWCDPAAAAMMPDYVIPTGKVNGEGQVEMAKPKMVPATVRKYSDRMLELEAKRTNPGYREKGSIDMNVKGGILVVGAPTPAEDTESLREEFNNPKGRTIEQQPAE